MTSTTSDEQPATQRTQPLAPAQRQLANHGPTIEAFDAIADALQLYIDGVARGDAAKLTAAFPDAQMAEHPADTDATFRARITSIVQARSGRRRPPGHAHHSMRRALAHRQQDLRSHRGRDAHGAATMTETRTIRPSRQDRSASGCSRHTSVVQSSRIATTALALVAAMAAYGCGGGSNSVAAAPTPAPTAPLSLVTLGDSIAFPPCPRCKSFSDLWGTSVRRDLGRPVKVVTDARPDAEATDTLKQVRTDAATRADLNAADLIVIQIGFNDTPWNRKDDPCHAAPEYPIITWAKITRRCIDRVARQYEQTLDAILTEVDTLRAGRPTALRLTTLYNAVIGNHVDPSWDSPAAVVPSKAANARFALLQCRLAAKHHGNCVAVHRAFNGSDGSKPAGRLLAKDYTHVSTRGHKLIARLLTQSGTEPVR